MDKYEFNLKVDQIRKMVNKGDYGTAKRIADGIDWNKVRSNANLLSMISQVYEKNRDYRNAKDILLMAYERAPIGKRLLYKLTELAIKEESVEEAEDYYREFCDLAGDDPRQYLLRYKLLKQKDAPKEQMIHALESYTAEELDEKWLYELALLYHENGDEGRCISTCDRLTLMFGLGKYVDKAIELKMKHAPLSKYQRDLVDNREAYEEKLRMVERSFQDDEDEDYLQDEEVLSESFPEDVPEISKEQNKSKEPLDFKCPPVSQYESASEDRASEEPPVAQQGPATRYSPASEHLFAAEKTVPPVYPSSESKESPKASKIPTPVRTEPELATSGSYREDELVAEAEQAETEEFLARELSRMQSHYYEENDLEKTRVIGDLRQARSESRRKKTQPQPQPQSQPHTPVQPQNQSYSVPSETESGTPSKAAAGAPRRAIHLMIESRDPERGIDIAVEALRQVRQFTGVKNPVAKITGAGLNRKGVLASAEKLAGKDLIVEEAGDMELGTIDELERLMSRDNTGMRIVLIDNPKQVEMLERKNPSLAEWFDFIREEDVVVEVPEEQPPQFPEEPTEYASMPYGYPEEELPTGESYGMPMEDGAYSTEPAYGAYPDDTQAMEAYGDNSSYQEFGNEPYEENAMYEQSSENLYGDQSAYGGGLDNSYEDSSAYEEALNRSYENPSDYEEVTENPYGNIYHYGQDTQETQPEIDDRPVRRVIPVRDQAMRAPDEDDSFGEMPEEEPEEEMGIDEFAQYACQYATEIDCSITGKSMLALYERIEIMEEDGIRLTRENAEALIEEAADRAEKPSLGKAIKGIFSSKYNKDGLLILKEEHFI